jgi:hypothetical protein
MAAIDSIQAAESLVVSFFKGHRSAVRTKPGIVRCCATGFLSGGCGSDPTPYDRSRQPAQTHLTDEAFPRLKGRTVATGVTVVSPRPTCSDCWSTSWALALALGAGAGAGASAHIFLMVPPPRMRRLRWLSMCRGCCRTRPGGRPGGRKGCHQGMAGPADGWLEA